MWSARIVDEYASRVIPSRLRSVSRAIDPDHRLMIAAVKKYGLRAKSQVHFDLLQAFQMSDEP